MNLPRDLSGEEVARLLSRHYGYRVRRTRGSHMTATLETADGTHHSVTVPEAAFSPGGRPAARHPRSHRQTIPARVARDRAFRNARQNSDEQNVRIEHDRALLRVMTSVTKDDSELFKQFMDNDGFKRWMTDTVFSRWPPAIPG